MTMRSPIPHLPLSNPDSANEVSATQWVIPGKHLTGGDGWLLEMPGLSVTAESSIASNGDLIVIAKVTMMCGCPIEPNGLWDANDYEVAAILTDDTGKSTTEMLVYAGRTSTFRGDLPLPGNGPFELLVYAHNSDTGNTGVDSLRFTGPR